MTTIGGLGHAMPCLVPDSWANAFWIAIAGALATKTDISASPATRAVMPA